MARICQTSTTGMVLLKDLMIYIIENVYKYDLELSAFIPMSCLSTSANNPQNSHTPNLNFKHHSLSSGVLIRSTTEATQVICVP